MRRRISCWPAPHCLTACHRSDYAPSRQQTTKTVAHCFTAFVGTLAVLLGIELAVKGSVASIELEGVELAAKLNCPWTISSIQQGRRSISGGLISPRANFILFLGSRSSLGLRRSIQPLAPLRVLAGRLLPEASKLVRRHVLGANHARSLTCEHLKRPVLCVRLLLQALILSGSLLSPVQSVEGPVPVLDCVTRKSGMVAEYTAKSFSSRVSNYMR